MEGGGGAAWAATEDGAASAAAAKKTAGAKRPGRIIFNNFEAIITTRSGSHRERRLRRY